jgi:hypothetical protein
MDEIRWNARATFDDREPIDASLSIDGEFTCSDEDVEIEVSCMAFAGSTTFPIGQLVGIPTLVVKESNPASMAAAFYRIVLSLYENPSFQFSNSTFLLPGYNVDISNDGEYDGWYEEIKIGPIVQNKFILIDGKLEKQERANFDV